MCEFSKWVPSSGNKWTFPVLNLRKKFNFVPVNFYDWKMRMCQWRYFRYFSLLSISSVFISHVCVFLWKIIQKQRKQKLGTIYKYSVDKESFSKFFYSINIGHQKVYPGKPLKTARPEKIRKTPETFIKYPSRCQVSVLHMPCLFHCFWLSIPLGPLIWFARKDF